MEFSVPLLELFNPRELSLLVWNLVIVASLGIWVLDTRESRESFFNFWGELKKKIIFVTLGFFVYVAALVVLLAITDMWSQKWTINTCFWFFGTALVIYFRVNKAAEQGLEFFKQIILNEVALIVILEFIINLYTFPLIIELILVPVVTLLVLIDAVAGTDQQFKPVRKLLRFLLSLIFLTLLSFSVWDIVVNFENYRSFVVLYSFVLPVILTLLTLPFFYLLSLFMVYEVIFNRIDRFFREKDSPATVRWEILRHCNLNLSRLKRVLDGGVNHLKGLETKEEVRNTLIGEGEDEPKLPRNKREQIHWELIKAEDRASVEADIKFPTRIKDITAGFTFENERRVMIDGQPFPAGSKIEITGRLGKSKSSPITTFRVKAFDQDDNLIAEGNLEGSFLLNQGLELSQKNRKRNLELREELQAKYEKKVLNKFGIDKNEVAEISKEAIENEYPTPDPLTIDEYLGNESI